MPLEGLDPTSEDGSREFAPEFRPGEEMEVRAQSEVGIEEIHLLADDEAAAIRLLQERGLIDANFDPGRQMLQAVPVTRVAQRRAMRDGLDMRVRQAAARVLGERGVSPEGRDLDRQRLGRSNFIVLKSAIDRRVNALVGRSTGQRSEFVREELDRIDAAFDRLVEEAEREVFHGN